MTADHSPKTIWQCRAWLRRAFYAMLSGFLFAYGVGVGQLEAKSAITSQLLQKPANYNGEQ